VIEKGKKSRGTANVTGNAPISRSKSDMQALQRYAVPFACQQKERPGRAWAWGGDAREGEGREEMARARSRWQLERK